VQDLGMCVYPWSRLRLDRRGWGMYWAGVAKMLLFEDHQPPLPPRGPPRHASLPCVPVLPPHFAVKNSCVFTFIQARRPCCSLFFLGGCAVCTRVVANGTHHFPSVL
jgi:hypothetical protein